MSNKFEDRYSDYSKRIAINEDIDANIEYTGNLSLEIHNDEHKYVFIMVLVLIRLIWI